MIFNNVIHAIQWDPLSFHGILTASILPRGQTVLSLTVLHSRLESRVENTLVGYTHAMGSSLADARPFYDT